MKRVLAILCVLAMLCALAVPVMATETADNVRIYAYVPSDWTEAYLYVWKGAGGDGEVPTAWPGVKMDVEGDSWFSAEVPGDMTWAIVSNGSQQTADLEILSGIDQWITVGGDMSAEVFYEEPTADQLPSNEPGAAPAGSVVVHAQVPADWTTPCVYSWIKDGQGPAWPGDAMTQDGDWWVANVDAGNNQVIISNNGTPQTVDLTVEAGKEAWVVVTEAGADGKFLADVYHEDPANGGQPIAPQEPAEPTTPEIPENASFYVAGYAALCGEDWNPGAEANKMTVGASGLYEKTYENVPAGEYALKVTIGNWDLSWGGDGADGNYVFTLETASTVTVKFDAETQTVSVETSGAAVEETDPPATEAPTDAPATEAPTQAPTLAPADGSDTAEQPKDNTALIIIIFVVVSAGAIGGALLYKKKQK